MVDDPRTVLGAFSALHLVLAVLFGEYALWVATDYNFVHLFDLAKHPELWMNDFAVGSIGAYFYLISLTSSIPIALHEVLGVSLEGLYWIEYAAKAPLFLVLLYGTIRGLSETHETASITLLFCAFLGFRILSTNLHSYQSGLYINYYSDTYLLVFLATLIALYREKWLWLGLLLFVGPLTHASMGLIGGALIIVLSFFRGCPYRILALICLAACSSLAIEKTLIDHAMQGQELIADDSAWENIATNGHLLFPFLRPTKFVKVVVALGILAFASYTLSDSLRGRRDLVIAICFVCATAVVFCTGAYLQNQTVVKLALMRSSVLFTLIALVNLGSGSWKNLSSFRARGSLAALILCMIHFCFGWTLTLACLLVSIVVVVRQTLFRPFVYTVLFLSLLVWPVQRSLGVLDTSRDEVELCSWVRKHIEPGATFLAWGGFAGAFRTKTRCQLVDPRIVGKAVYWNTPENRAQEIELVEVVLGREIDREALYSPSTLASLRGAVNEPITPEQMNRFRNRWHVQYLIYPQALDTTVDLGSPVFENEEYRIFSLVPSLRGPSAGQF